MFFPQIQLLAEVEQKRTISQVGFIVVDCFFPCRFNVKLASFPGRLGPGNEASANHNMSIS